SSRSSWRVASAGRSTWRSGPPNDRRHLRAQAAREEELMAVRKIKNHGKWVWLARVAYKKHRRAAFRATKEEARQAESDLLRQLKEDVASADREAAGPATLRALFEFYAEDMQARGKGEEGVDRVGYAAVAVGR